MLLGRMLLMGGPKLPVPSVDFQDGGTFALGGYAVNQQSQITLRLFSDGSADHTFVTTDTSNDPPTSEEWLPSADQETGIGAEFECRLTVNSGDAPTGGDSTGSWLRLDTDREWYLNGPGIQGTNAGNWTLEIGEYGSNSAITSTTFDVDSSWIQI
jgi:hypothetical protein